jgi:hypothetical protein
MIGDLAFSNSSFNLEILFSSIMGLLIFSFDMFKSGFSTSSAAISSGNSIATAQGLSEVAILTALFRI